MRSGQPSHTARRVAAYRLAARRLATPYGSPDADQQLGRDVAGGVVIDDHSPMASYLTARTAFVDRAVVGAIEQGTRQVVVAGAGYDGRSLRYAKPGVRWFELDHPATQADKIERLARLGLVTPGVSYLPVDFRTGNTGAALAAAGHDDTAASLFVCEGVAVYLDHPVLDELLRSMRRRAAEGSELAITVSVSPVAPGSIERRRRFEAAVARMGEPARTVLTADEAQVVFTAAGWSADAAAVTTRAGLAGLVTAVPAGIDTPL